MKKLRKGDLCKIWGKDFTCWGIFEDTTGFLNAFYAVSDDFNIPINRENKIDQVVFVPFSKSTKVTVWKKSSFEKKIIKFGLVVRDGKFVDNKIIVKEMSDGLSKLFSGYSAKTLIEELTSVRDDFEKQQELIKK